MTKQETHKIDELLEGQRILHEILSGSLEKKGLVHLVDDLWKAQEQDEQWKKETGITLEALKITAEKVMEHDGYIEKEKERRLKQAGIAAGSGGVIGGIIALWDKIQGAFQ